MTNRTHAVLSELSAAGKPAIPNTLVEQPVGVVACRNFYGSGRADTMVFAQPDHDRDCCYEREALTEPGGESDGISDAEVATLIGHEHSAVPETIEDAVIVDGAFEWRTTPRVSATHQPRPVGIPF